VVQAHAGVPDRIPELVGDRPDVSAAVVDQDKVKITAERGVTPAQRTDRDKGDPRAVVTEELRQPAVEQLHESDPKLGSDEGGPGDERRELRTHSADG
jgi:hypothetical protein